MEARVETGVGSVAYREPSASNAWCNALAAREPPRNAVDENARSAGRMAGWRGAPTPRCLLYMRAGSGKVRAGPTTLERLSRALISGTVCLARAGVQQWSSTSVSHLRGRCGGIVKSRESECQIPNENAHMQPDGSLCTCNI